jgi:peptidyl-prolyl cis-trans isomerase A (cyclophilin A)
MLSGAQSQAQTAIMSTTAGQITIQLFPDKSPKTVENFIGLATGKKDWKDARNGRTRKNKPYYNGTIFHRVAPGFMIQGGDQLGTGAGGAGYFFENERHPSLVFDRPGLLAMANAGEGTNSAQFFITVAPATFLGNRYTIFGEVTSGIDVVNKIVNAPRVPNSERPVAPTVIKSITIK